MLHTNFIRNVSVAFTFVLINAAAMPAAQAEDPEFPGVVAPTDKPATWGLGVAAGTEHGVYKGTDNRTTVIPLILYDNEYVHLFGATADLKLPSVDAFHFALRAKYSLGAGYKASDSAYLSGMAERNGGLFLGGAATWQAPWLTLSAEWLKAAGQSKGQEFALNAEHTFAVGRFRLTPHIGAEWYDDKYVDYYYGVQANEATASRPQYTGAATTNVGAGLRVTYVLKKNQSLLLDLSDTHKGNNISNSPLVDKTTTPGIRIGYLYNF